MKGGRGFKLILPHPRPGKTTHKKPSLIRVNQTNILILVVSNATINISTNTTNIRTNYS